MCLKTVRAIRNKDVANNVGRSAGNSAANSGRNAPSIPRHHRVRRKVAVRNMAVVVAHNQVVVVRRRSVAIVKAAMNIARPLVRRAMSGASVPGDLKTA